MSENWQLPGVTKDAQSITRDWTPADLTLIDGVAVREMRNVPKGNGVLTEVFRAEWEVERRPVDQVFQVVLYPGGISAWHAHRDTTDRLFVSAGMLRIALYDGRQDSPTHGLVNEFRFGAARPALVTIPPRVWHGIQNFGPEAALVINLVDRAYHYEDPDHWRVPPDSEQIPFRFPGVTGARDALAGGGTR